MLGLDLRLGWGWLRCENGLRPTVTMPKSGPEQHPVRLDTQHDCCRMNDTAPFLSRKQNHYYSQLYVYIQNQLHIIFIIYADYNNAIQQPVNATVSSRSTARYSIQRYATEMRGHWQIRKLFSSICGQSRCKFKFSCRHDTPHWSERHVRDEHQL